MFQLLYIDKFFLQELFFSVLVGSLTYRKIFSRVFSCTIANTMSLNKKLNKSTINKKLNEITINKKLNEITINKKLNKITINKII